MTILFFLYFRITQVGFFIASSSSEMPLYLLFIVRNFQNTALKMANG